MKQLAVIMSIYINDTLEYLKECIQSLKVQSYKEFHVYIQYDGKISSHCDQYLSSLNDDRFFLFKRDRNLGLAASLNDLLEIVLKNDYLFIARMDADDICLPERFEKQLQFLYLHNEIDCVGTWANEIDENGNNFFLKKMPASHEECLKFFKKRDCLIHPTVMFRRSFFELAGFYPLNTYYAEDSVMWAKGFQNGCKFSNLQEPLFYFRLNKDFFKRRRGLKHAISIFSVRFRINKMLNFTFDSYIYAFAYALIKLLPNSCLRWIYNNMR